MPETLPGESSQLPAPPEHSRGAGEEEAGQEVLKQSGAALRGWGVGVQGWGGVAAGVLPGAPPAFLL